MKTIAVPVEPMWGITDNADFDEYTWTFKMSGDYRVASGAYAIIPDKEYKALVAALSAAPPQPEPSDHLADPDSRERAMQALGEGDQNDAPQSEPVKERWFDGGININLHQAREILAFFGGEDADMTLKWLDKSQGTPTDDPDDQPETGLHIWCTDYPEEGVAYIRETPRNAAPEHSLCYASDTDKLHCAVCGRELLDLAVSAAPRIEDELLKPQTVLKITAPDMQSLPSSDKEWKGPYVQPNSSGSMGDKSDNAAPEQSERERRSSPSQEGCAVGTAPVAAPERRIARRRRLLQPLSEPPRTDKDRRQNAAGQVDPVKAISTGQPASQSDRPVPAAPVSSAEAYAMDCEGYAVPAAPTPGTEFYWLIEREQGGSHVPTVWYSGRADERNTDYNEWTDNVYLALRFASQSDAEKVAARLFCPRSVRVRKHGFDIRSVMFCDPSFDTPTTANLGEDALSLSAEQIIDAKKFFAGGFGIELCDQALHAIEFKKDLKTERDRSKAVYERAHMLEQQIAEKDKEIRRYKGAYQMVALERDGLMAELAELKARVE